MRRLPGLLVLLLLLAGCAGPDSGAGPAGSSSASTTDETEPSPPPADSLSWAWERGGPALPFGLAESALAMGAGGAGGFLVGGFVAPAGGANVVLRVPVSEGSDVEAEVPPYPLPIHHAQAAVLDGVLHVFGGYVGGTPNPLAVAGQSEAGWPLTAAAFRLDGEAWVPIADLPEGRAAGGAVAVNGTILIVGGTTDEGHPASVLRYDPASDSYDEAAPLPVPRDHLNVLALDGLVYAIAGRDIVSAQVDDLPSFEVYDPAADSWTVLPDCPLGRGGQAAAVLAGRVVVAGGERIEGTFTVYGDVHAYDAANRTWVALPAMPEARHGGALVKVGDALVYLGGATLDDGLASESLTLRVA